MISNAMNIFVATTPVDLRRSFDGLAAAVRDSVKHDPMNGALFVFYNKRMDRLKALWWDRTGYCLLYKRLESGFFRIPKPLSADATHIAIDAAELARILEGIGLPKSRIESANAA